MTCWEQKCLPQSIFQNTEWPRYDLLVQFLWVVFLGPHTLFIQHLSNSASEYLLRTNVRLQVFVELDNTKLELLHPYGEESPIENFLKKNKAGGIHHICLEVDDIRSAVTKLKEDGVAILNEVSWCNVAAHHKQRKHLFRLLERQAIFVVYDSRIAWQEPKIGAHGKPVVFLHPKSCNGVLTELEEV